VIVTLLRLLFVFPLRLQKWIDRLLVAAGMAMFLWNLWKRIDDHRPKARPKPRIPPLPPPAWDRADPEAPAERLA
jgi:hypothetical protein